MVRPREFDREEALRKATLLFWEKGFAATSTDNLLKAMGIARQSLYNAFGDKRQLYLEVLQSYRETSIGGHLRRLNEPRSPLEGVRQLLLGVGAADDDIRALGCLGVGALCEFGTSDEELSQLAQQAGQLLAKRLSERIREGQKLGEMPKKLDVESAVGFVQLTMNGLMLAARAGASLSHMQRLADFAVDRLKMP